MIHPGQPRPRRIRIQRIDVSGQRGHRGEFEDLPHTDIDAERVAHGRNEFGCQQRVTAEVEERVVSTHSVAAEQLTEQLGKAPLGGRLRRAELGVRRDLRFRQRGAVDFAMRGDRNLIQHNIGRGQHIFRQCRGHPGADAVEIDADIGGSVAARGGCHVAHQTLAQPRQVANHHNGLPDRRVDRDGRCYVTEFDSESANLDLLVGTAHELDVTVSIAARQIPGPVHAGTGIKRVGNESLRGQPGAAMVSVCDMRPSNIDLADHTGRHRLQRIVEQVHGGVDLGPADGHDAGALWAHHFKPAGVDHGFGWTVEVVQQRIECRVELVGHLTG
ncbi:Uncharacterised protein [Mycobacterium tuberculosis]|nr:Uncharacterised protein [Mycobacterium tuberculosis]